MGVLCDCVEGMDLVRSESKNWGLYQIRTNISGIHPQLDLAGELIVFGLQLLDVIRVYSALVFVGQGTPNFPNRSKKVIRVFEL